MSRLQQIGSAFVRLFVKKDELDRGLNEAKAQVDQAAQEMNASAQKAATGFSGVASSLKSATKPARDLVSAITSTLGIFTRILGIVGLIGTAVGALVIAWEKIATYGERQAKALQDQIDRQRDLSNTLRAANEKSKQQALEELQARLNIQDQYRKQSDLERKLNEARESGDGRLRTMIASLEKQKAAVDENIRAYEQQVALLEKSVHANKELEQAKKVQNFDRMVVEESAKSEVDAAKEAVRIREAQIEAAREASREILSNAKEEQEILAESAKTRAQIHKDEMKRIKERKIAELRAIEEARNQTLSAISSLQSVFNNPSIGYLARIEKLVRVFLERPIDKRN